MSISAVSFIIIHMFLSVSWPKLQHEVYTLSQKIQTDSFKPDVIIAIARGGLTISHILSDFITTAVTSFTMRSYADFSQEKAPELLFSMGGEIKGKTVLLTDDVSDTGSTFITGIEYLKTVGVHTVKTAAVYKKPWSKYTPDYWVTETDKWIVFPYDVRESIEALIQKADKEGLSSAEIRRQCVDELDFSPEFVDDFLKKN